MIHLTKPQLDAALSDILECPPDAGKLEMIIARPAVGERIELTDAELCTERGLVGDSWLTRGSSRTKDGKAHPDMQLTVMNSRVVQLLAGARERWSLAGDQLYVDMDLGVENLPTGTVLTLGSARIMVTDQPHTGCKKFVQRFGADAMKWVNAPQGRSLSLRGINARVIQGGTFRQGDVVKKVGQSQATGTSE